MKDYSTSGDDSKTYIRSYKLDGSTITVTFANGDEHKIPYNEENLAIIVKIMRYQDVSAKPYPIKNSFKIMYLTNALCLLIHIINYMNEPSVFRGSMIGLCGFVIVLGASRLIVYVKKKMILINFIIF